MGAYSPAPVLTKDYLDRITIEIIKPTINELNKKNIDYKGVIIPNSKDECFRAAESILSGKFGESGKVVVLEEKIQGPEVSVFALCDGKKYILLPTAQDHKRLNEKDEGPNTGGMGAYSPAPLLKEDHLKEIAKKIIEPTIRELNKKNIEYKLSLIHI